MDEASRPRRIADGKNGSGRTLRVLGFDTSGPWCAASLIGGGVVDRFETMERGQSERLMPLLEDVLHESGAEWSDLDAIGVGVGPGNFTGIRIGVAAARGLGLALQVPVVGITMFEVLHAGFSRSGRVMLSLPGPRDQAFVQVFANGAPLGPAEMLTPGEMRDELRQPNLCVLGWRAEDIAHPYGAAFEERVFDGPSDGTVLSPSSRMIARTIANLAHAKSAGDLLWDGERPRPLYVRPADAAPPSDPPPVILP